MSGVSFTEVRLNTTIKILFKSGMARDKMILITLARVLILGVYLCFRGTYKSLLGKAFCPGVGKIILSLWGLQLPYVVYFLPFSALTN